MTELVASGPQAPGEEGRCPRWPRTGMLDAENVRGEEGETRHTAAAPKGPAFIPESQGVAETGHEVPQLDCKGVLFALFPRSAVSPEPNANPSYELLEA